MGDKGGTTHGTQAPDASRLIESGLKRFETLDIEEQAAQLSGWNQHYAQVSKGAFSGGFVEIDLGEAKLFIETTSNSLLQKGVVDDGMVALGLPISSHAHGYFCGHALTEQTLHVFSGASGFEYLSPPDLRMAGLIISSQAFNEKIAFHTSDKLLHSASSPGLITVVNEKNRDLRQLLKDVSSMAQLCPHVFQNKDITTTLGEKIISGFVESFVSNMALEPIRLSVAQRVKIINSVRDIVADNPGNPPDISEISSLLKVSRRTLQYCFNESLGCSPLDFIKAIRLNGVRAMLKSCNSVSEAATHWGFWHFGNFSSDYRAFFNRLPSEDFALHRGSRNPGRSLYRPGLSGRG